ncbi:DsbA family protein [Calothrix sp. PCC 6303]|uniref:DsbA family oxidoreductase n=1 Tax=Calothrix sp. PCC 6303 TaxID=1170562 RepID=UPI0002A0312A|nr:hypothetical protein [Calothrix sp. PCC 6303]AFZ01789.1 hypothetical protein Cal6303_2827 [Calothrix sp. PCC 6303]
MVFFGRSLVTLPSHVSRPFLLKSLILLGFSEFCQAVSRWREKGGLQGYSNHVQEVAKKFDHISVHPDIWTKVTPFSSKSSHLFLHAIQLLEKKGLVEQNQQVFEKAIWAFREAFFTQLADISDRKVQFGIAEELKLPIAAIQAQIDSGEAYAELSKDFELVKEHTVTVSLGC